MGESTSPRAKLRFDRRVRLEFRGATITSDAGLLACRELDDALGLTETADECLQDTRGGRNVQHRLVGLLRQSVYSRLAGYEDTNDAERLAQDPTMRIIVGRRGGPERPAASTNTMSRFETEVLTQDGNVEGLDRLNAEWVDGAMSRTPHRRVILDMDSSESPVHGDQEAQLAGDLKTTKTDKSMVHGRNRTPYWIDRRLSGLAEPDYDATISFGLPIEPEDSQ